MGKAPLKLVTRSLAALFPALIKAPQILLAALKSAA
ncbi:hypothetical protein Gotri_024125, partial [Gossypium trilobum]|nr:hypothetical protein [Gossypium trilobum]